MKRKQSKQQDDRLLKRLGWAERRYQEKLRQAIMADLWGEVWQSPALPELVDATTPPLL